MNCGLCEVKRFFTEGTEGVAAEGEDTIDPKVNRTFLQFSLATTPGWSQERCYSHWEK